MLQYRPPQGQRHQQCITRVWAGKAAGPSELVRSSIFVISLKCAVLGIFRQRMPKACLHSFKHAAWLLGFGAPSTQGFRDTKLECPGNVSQRPSGPNRNSSHLDVTVTEAGASSFVLQPGLLQNSKTRIPADFALVLDALAGSAQWCHETATPKHACSVSVARGSCIKMLQVPAQPSA